VQVLVLLVDERPEEVTAFRRGVEAEIYAASSDLSPEQHVELAERCLTEALRPVVDGRDVLILLDSITRLARAYNTVNEGVGRTMSGGIDAATMHTPRQIFGAARKIESGGSLTIVGTALIDTGSRMDQVIFEEFKGTGNTEIVLSRQLFERRIFPAIDISQSGTRKEEKLYPPEQVRPMQTLRRALSEMDKSLAMRKLLDLLARYPTNADALAAVGAALTKKTVPEPDDLP
jgi:transcription termination factor Rho